MSKKRKNDKSFGRSFLGDGVEIDPKVYHLNKILRIYRMIVSLPFKGAKISLKVNFISNDQD